MSNYTLYNSIVLLLTLSLILTPLHGMGSKFFNKVIQLSDSNPQYDPCDDPNSLVACNHINNFTQGQSSKIIDLYNNGIFGGSIKLLNKEIATEPHNIRILLDLGLSYEKMGNHTMGFFFLKKVLKEADSNPQYLDQRGAALTVLGNYVEALKIFKQALQINKHDISALYGLGSVDLLLKNYTGGNQIFEHILNLPIPHREKQPWFIDALIAKSSALIFLHDYKSALNFLNYALVLNSHQIDALYNKGLLEQHFGNFTGAIDNYNKVLAIAPNNKDTLYHKQWTMKSLEYDLYHNGTTLNDKGMYSQALPYLRQALALNASDTDVLENLGNALFHLGNHTALKFFNKAISLNSSDPDAWWN